MTRPQTVAVIGLGLIGGSVARALSARGARVKAFDRNAASMNSAVTAGVVYGRLSESLDEIAETDTVVIALPGDAARELISRCASNLGRARLVMDVGSAKRLVASVAEDAGIGRTFVGSHPLAGDHRCGWEASRAGLFEGQKGFLCPSSSTSDESYQAAEKIWTSIGATTVAIDAAVHDSQMAWISHLPHMLSSALALTLSDAGISRSDLGPGGREMTRLAGSSPEMWTAIAHENASAIAAAISLFEERLAELKSAVMAGDSDRFCEQFAAGREWFGGS